jgi:RNA polymerase sigma-70 factor (ECF subfamily)
MGTQNRLAKLDARSLGEEWALVQRALTGDRGSQDRLFTAHAARLYRAAFAVLRNREDAEDAVQDGLYNAYTKLRSFQGRSSFSTWLTRIVINSALMTRRRKRIGVEASLDEILENQQGWLPDGIVDRRPDPEEACGATEINRLFDEEIRRLPVTLRVAFQLREVDGFSTKESSRMLGILESSVKTRLFRARRKLTYELRGSI